MKKLIAILIVLAAGCSPNYVELNDISDNFTKVYKSIPKPKGKFLFLTEDSRTEREIATILQNENAFGIITKNKFKGLEQFHRLLYNNLYLLFPDIKFDTLTISDQNLLEDGKIELQELTKKYQADGIFMGKLYNFVMDLGGNFRGTYRFQLKKIKGNKTLISGLIERKHNFKINNIMPFYIPFFSNWIASKMYKSAYNTAKKWFVDEVTKAITQKAELSKKYYDFDRGFTGKREKSLSRYQNLSYMIGAEYILSASAYTLMFIPDFSYTKEIYTITAGLFPVTVITQDYINGNASGSMSSIGCLGSLLAGYSIYKDIPGSGDFMRPLLVGTVSLMASYYGNQIRFQKKRNYRGGLKKK